MFKQDRCRFIAAHAGLRLALGGMLGHRPDLIVFSENDCGKPCLADAANPRLHFNLSHSDEFAAAAIATGLQVGIDVEQLRATDLSGVVSFFSAFEQAGLGGLPDKDRTASAFRTWTRKEAFVKAIGCGSTIPLDSFDVSILPDKPRLLRVAGAPDEPAQ